MYAPHKDKILELRTKGYSYGQIQSELGCSKGTISFHLGNGQKDKYRKRNQKRRKNNPYTAKIERFITRKYKKSYKLVNKRTNKNLLYEKIRRFHGALRGFKMKEANFTVEDVINKFGENPKCYLTGKDIDIYKPRTYQFDHIIPVSRGGTNTLDNLGICTKLANQSKTNMTIDEFLLQCKEILEYNGYKISKEQ